jgi:hypothetical protein
MLGSADRKSDDHRFTVRAPMEGWTAEGPVSVTDRQVFTYGLAKKQPQCCHISMFFLFPEVPASAYVDGWVP